MPKTKKTRPYKMRPFKPTRVGTCRGCASGDQALQRPGAGEFLCVSCFLLNEHMTAKPGCVACKEDRCPYRSGRERSRAAGLRTGGILRGDGIATYMSVLKIEEIGHDDKVIVFEHEVLDCTLVEAARAIVRKFLMTPRGRNLLEAGDGHYNWNDVLCDIPAEFWAANGLKRVLLQAVDESVGAYEDLSALNTKPGPRS